MSFYTRPTARMNWLTDGKSAGVQSRMLAVAAIRPETGTGHTVSLCQRLDNAAKEEVLST